MNITSLDSLAHLKDDSIFGNDFCKTWAEIMVTTMAKRGVALCRNQQELATLLNTDMKIWNICFECGWINEGKGDCCEEHRYQHTIHSLAI